MYMHMCQVRVIYLHITYMPTCGLSPAFGGEAACLPRNPERKPRHPQRDLSYYHHDRHGFTPTQAVAEQNLQGYLAHEKTHPPRIRP